ncbi:MAG: NAD(P)H-dependent glycerol-3-phosphate dehydrogenase [Clostridia bacterium]|nr:NAD(P)H-dependent glycerol-3-phosphate dehydrogenase [Clostridia bacterium]MBQ7751952.1 NAD(P)H-dependent glycerol-3-phosphate dehydrogenase [Clostridia bacterium]
MKIAVIGSGSWGCAAAILLANKGYDVHLWSWQQEETDRLNKDRENKDVLPGKHFPDNIICSHDMAFCVKDADLIVTVAPSIATRSTAKQLKQCIANGQVLVNLSKGLEDETLLTLSAVYREELPNAKIAVMSGPSHAEEVSVGLPTVNVVACDDMDVAKYIQNIFNCDFFRVYTADDILGVELGGAIKNVIALCAGISDGIGYGDNTRAALMTRGIAEIRRLGVAMGAKEETFAGLSGIGDLIVTCTSMHSRNHRAGILLGEGYTLTETLEKVHMVVEGVNTARAAYALSQKYGVAMPITEEAYKVLFEDKPAKEAVKSLMNRDLKPELN